MDIPDITNEVLPIEVEYIDPIDKIIYNYSKHPSIIKIIQIIKSNDNFSFHESKRNQINQNEIEQEIVQLNEGPDAITPKIIKDSIIVVKAPLTTLFNTSVKESLFPSGLKYGNVSPLYKKDENTKKENYRPISILPSISTFFERLMFQQITSYVSNLLSPYLCGFRKGYNVQHALLRLKNSLNMNLDKHKSIGLLMMDLSKAFDCIPHNLLIAKLHAYGFTRKSLSLIFSYLKGRHQRVKINADYSSWKEILHGVPQGSVLGPLFVNIFMNDLFLIVEHSDVCNYADDNSLTVADTSINTIISKLESDIQNLTLWFKNNAMLLNGDKCQFMITESSRTTRNNVARIKIDDKYVEESKKGKLLGITFDKNLTMDEHIKCM